MSGDLDAVWTAARAATADAGVAEAVTVTVLARSRGLSLARRRLVADAVRRAVALAPCPPLALLPPPEREAVALARFAGLDVEQIAAALGTDAPLARAHLTNGLRTIAPLEGGSAAPRHTSVTPCCSSHST